MGRVSNSDSKNSIFYKDFSRPTRIYRPMASSGKCAGDLFAHQPYQFRIINIQVRPSFHYCPQVSLFIRLIPHFPAIDINYKAVRVGRRPEQDLESLLFSIMYNRNRNCVHEKRLVSKVREWKRTEDEGLREGRRTIRLPRAPVSLAGTR